MQIKSYKFDVMTIMLSGLCLIHCLFLPVLVSSLPLFSVFAEAEWLHRLLVILAIPVSFLAFQKSNGSQYNMKLPAIAACLGVAILLSAAFVEPLHDHEKTLTAIGALTLAAAHIWRWNLHAS